MVLVAVTLVDVSVPEVVDTVVVVVLVTLLVVVLVTLVVDDVVIEVVVLVSVVVVIVVDVNVRVTKSFPTISSKIALRNNVIASPQLNPLASSPPASHFEINPRVQSNCTSVAPR